MVRCKTHPKYTGMRVGRISSECPGCIAYYNEQRKTGVREKRSRKEQVASEPAAEATVEVTQEVVQEETQEENTTENVVS